MRKWAAIFWSVILLLICIEAEAQAVNYDSIREILKNAPNQNKLSVLEAVVQSIWLNQPDRAAEFANIAYRMGDSGDMRAKSIGLRLRAGIFYYQGKYDSSLILNRKAMECAIAAKDSILMANAMNNLGMSLYSIGSYEEALYNILMSMDIRKRIKSVNKLGYVLNNIGLLYSKLKMYDMAINYFDEAKKHWHKNDEVLCSYTLNNLGETYLLKLFPRKAEEAFKSSLSITKNKPKLKRLEAVSLAGLANVFYEYNNTAVASAFLKKSELLRHEIRDNNGLAELKLQQAKIFLKINQTDSAKRYVKSSESIARELGNKDLISQCFLFKKELYFSTGKIDSALLALHVYLELKESLVSSRALHEIADIQARIDRENSTKRFIEKENEIRKFKNQTLTFLTVSSVMLLGALLFYKLLKIQKQLNQKLVSRNEEILDQKIQIDLQRKELVKSCEELKTAQETIKIKNEELLVNNELLECRALRGAKQLEKLSAEMDVINQELDTFIYRCSHDIRGPILRLVGVCQLALLSIKDQESRRYFDLLLRTSRHIIKISERLKTVFSVIERKPIYSVINFDSLLDHILDNLNVKKYSNEIKVIKKIEGNSNFRIDLFLVETALRNLIKNSAQALGKSTLCEKWILVETRADEQCLTILVRDNGAGVPKELEPRLFDMFVSRSRTGVGLGLYTVKKCIEKLGGTINFVSENLNTEFKIMLPLDLKPFVLAEPLFSTLVTNIPERNK